MSTDHTLKLIKELRQAFAANLTTVVSKEDSYAVMQAYTDAESAALTAYLDRIKSKYLNQGKQ